MNERPDDALAIVQQIADCGVRVALDEFGSSLAAFNSLVRLPIDLVKMDSRLSIAAVKAGSRRALSRSVLHLGNRSVCKRWRRESRPRSNWMRCAAWDANWARGGYSRRQWMPPAHSRSLRNASARYLPTY